MIRQSFFYKPLILLACCSLATIGCKQNSPKVKITTESENGSQLIKINKVTFSVPSPLQVAMLLKKTNTNYNKALLNSADNVSRYSTNYSKALNLGIYTADIGYTVTYDQTQDAILYLHSAQELASSLSIVGSFEKEMMDRFQKNITSQDSIFAIVTGAFNSSDNYLKRNNRKDIATLTVAGGWIEALHFLANVSKSSNNQEIVNRIGEQKVTLNNLIKLLMEFQEQKEIGALIDQLLELSNLYENVKITYSYKEPSIDIANKITTINSETIVIITKKQLTEITKQIDKIREQIVK